MRVRRGLDRVGDESRPGEALGGYLGAQGWSEGPAPDGGNGAGSIADVL